MFLFIFIFLFNFVYGSQQKENVKLQRINLCDLKNKNLIAYNNLMQTLIHEVMGHLFSSYWLDSNDKECPFALILKNRTECEKTEMLGALGFTCSFRSSFYREKKSLLYFFLSMFRLRCTDSTRV